MGILDGIKGLLGMRAEADARRAADPEDLFGLSTAYLTMAADLDYDPAGEAALCFSAVDSTDFADAVREVESILEVGKLETGTEASFVEDSHGYSWVVFEDDDFEDLVTSVHFAADTLIERDYGSRLLAALFAFRKDGNYVYWVYSFRRGSFYPFAPLSGKERDSSAEFKLEATLDGELAIEADKEYWYPLWPGRRGSHPWE
jgi:hypothetical protein